MTRVVSALLLAVLCLSLAACSMPTTAGTSPAPRVFFTSPASGAEVASPVRVTMSSENFTVEPADAGVNAGAGHLHIMVDTPCMNPGEAVPRDDTHLHYGGGQVEAELELSPGAHTLCLQAADGAHVALEGAGMQQTINVTVE